MFNQSFLWRWLDQPALFSVLGVMITCLGVPGTAQAQTSMEATPQTFQQWCNQRSQWDQATQHTINALLKVAGTNNCGVADTTLSTLVALDLSDENITNLAPVASLHNLQMLWLYHNQISDISPLANLTNLTHLDLGHNELEDTTAIANLEQLQVLWLDHNRIDALPNLSNHSELNSLYVQHNQLSRIDAIEGVTNLAYFDVQGNPVADLTPIFALDHLKYVAWPGDGDLAKLIAGN